MGQLRYEAREIPGFTRRSEISYRREDDRVGIRLIHFGRPPGWRWWVFARGTHGGTVGDKNGYALLDDAVTVAREVTA